MPRFAALLGVVMVTLLLLLGEAEARTIVFRYTSANAIIGDYDNVRIEFSVRRTFGGQVHSVFVTRPSQAATPIVITDDGPSVVNPYLINAYVQPIVRRFPFPVFFPSPPGVGQVTVQVDDEPEVDVWMFIDPFEGLNSGPMGASFVF